MRRFIPLLVLAAVVGADEVEQLSPKSAWQKMEQELNDARQARDYKTFTDVRSKRPKEFLAAWAKSGKQAAGEELAYLGRFQSMGEQPVAAMKSFLSAVGDKSVSDELRTQAKVSYASAMVAAMAAGQLDDQAADEAIKVAAGFAESVGGEGPRGLIAMSIGNGHNQRKRHDAAIAAWMDAARINPGSASNAARSIFGALQHQALDLEKIGSVQARGKELLGELVKLYSGYVEEQQSMGNPNAARMAASITRLKGIGKPLSMIGSPAPVWTTEHAFSDVKALADLKGKVVMLDFWATWCPWCIKSFPALRDLLRDYKDKPLAVVGVTASSGAVWASRYELDEDFKDKITEGERTQPALQLPRGATEEQQAAHRAKEKEVLKTFISNHKMTWPVVMIDQQEPSSKFAVSGWPTAIIVDKAGRIRYFKSGALLRDREAQVKEFRALLDKLLAE